MLKVISKCVLVAAVAAFAVAGSSTASFAAKKKAGPASCAPWTYKTKACGPSGCSMDRCGWDGKWYPSLAFCMKPACPK